MDSSPVRSPLKQIPRGSRLADHVAEQLTSAILAGHLPSGTRLTEMKTAAELGVSRGPVREAFARLQRTGLLESRPYQGTVVAALTPRDVFELYTVRAPLEAMAVRLLTEMEVVPNLDRLQRVVEEMRDETSGTRLIDLDIQFHTLLIESSGHNLLLELWGTISVRLRKYLLLKHSRLYETPVIACRIHEEILGAILSGPPETAEGIILKHINASRLLAEAELAPPIVDSAASGNAS